MGLGLGSCTYRLMGFGLQARSQFVSNLSVSYPTLDHNTYPQGKEPA